MANLWRFNPTDSTNLGTMTDTSVVNVGSGNNRIEIRCQGSTITGLANGTQLLTAQDTTYTTGGIVHRHLVSPALRPIRC